MINMEKHSFVKILTDLYIVRRYKEVKYVY